MDGGWELRESGRASLEGYCEEKGSREGLEVGVAPGKNGGRLEPGQPTAYRAVLPRSSHLGLDCLDLLVAALEACKGMISPFDSGWPLMQGIDRYLGHGRQDRHLLREPLWLTQGHQAIGEGRHQGRVALRSGEAAG